MAECTGDSRNRDSRYRRQCSTGVSVSRGQWIQQVKVAAFHVLKMKAYQTYKANNESESCPSLTS